MFQKDLLAIGKILRVHGIGGKLKVLSFSGSSDIFFSIQELRIGKTTWESKPFRVFSIGGHGKAILIELEGVGTTEAKGLVGHLVWIRRDQLPELEQGEYYWADLIGLRVCRRDGRKVGVIEEIWNYGSSDIYVCREGEREILIPAVEGIVESIDLKEQRVIVADIEKLLPT